MPLLSPGLGGSCSGHGGAQDHKSQHMVVPLPPALAPVLQACRLLIAVALRSGCERKPPPSAQAPSRSSQPKFSLLDDSTLLSPLMDALTHFLTLASVVDFRGH